MMSLTAFTVIQCVLYFVQKFAMDMDERDTKRSTHSCYMDEHTRYKVTYLALLLEDFVLCSIIKGRLSKSKLLQSDICLALYSWIQGYLNTAEFN